jgi:cell division protein FtsQ
VPRKARPGRSASRAETIALPRAGRISSRRVLGTLSRFAPSRRSLAVGFGVLALAVAAYAVARETSIFAIGRIDVVGGSRQVDTQVEQALAPLIGKSLVGLDGTSVVRRAEALPTVVRASYDRAFPHVLRVTVVPERPVAVLRLGARAWLVSSQGRVIEPLAAHADPKLPRIWLGASSPVRVGEELTATRGGVAARTLGLAGRFRSRVAGASFAHGSVVFRLRTGLELVLGSPAGVRVKVAVAALALRALPTGSTYLDVSVPGRPVSGSGSTATTKSQVSSRD